MFWSASMMTSLLSSWTFWIPKPLFTVGQSHVLAQSVVTHWSSPNPPLYFGHYLWGFSLSVMDNNWSIKKLYKPAAHINRHLITTFCNMMSAVPITYSGAYAHSQLIHLCCENVNKLYIYVGSTTSITGGVETKPDIWWRLALSVLLQFPVIRRLIKVMSCIGWLNDDSAMSAPFSYMFN